MSRSENGRSDQVIQLASVSKIYGGKRSRVTALDDVTLGFQRRTLLKSVTV